MDYGLPVTAPPLDPPTTPRQPPVVAAEAAAEVATDATGVPAAEQSSGFTVRLANFTGPFDLLLQLISKHKLDVTEVALHRVTDEFIAYIRAMGDQWDLDETSEFLLIAATLLDLKAARLLPAAEVEDEEDLALLEARDLLFARLLQYKAYKEAAAHIAALEAVGGRRYPRAVTLEPRYAEALPDLVLGIGPERLRALAVRAMTPKPTPEVSIAHVHMVRVSVREHAEIITGRLRRAGTATFSQLCADCEITLEVVARFLALLELYRQGLVAFVQEQALEELTVRWTGPAEGDTELHVDEYAGATEASDADPAATVPGDTLPTRPRAASDAAGVVASGSATDSAVDAGLSGDSRGGGDPGDGDDDRRGDGGPAVGGDQGDNGDPGGTNGDLGGNDEEQRDE
ncbi:segregation and condensation protein A [Micromonospora coxensis]|uniref:Segregation and condensation protein A n=1 Tax=Micromonospora coxensis TaxID=356852 RepID=A0A1C5JV07_9ACTN|nr:ScpA family protein [Micromonospora coxensis]SCG74424.1 condensin subunit ScpA [Micromonospora coxensis]